MSKIAKNYVIFLKSSIDIFLFLWEFFECFKTLFTFSTRENNSILYEIGETLEQIKYYLQSYLVIITKNFKIIIS